MIIKINSPIALVCLLLCSAASSAHSADRVVIGNVSRTVEQLPNYASPMLLTRPCG